MIKLKNILKDKYNIATDVKLVTGSQHGLLFGDNGFIKVQIESPCTNPNCREELRRWVLRMAPSESFDRWSVSAAISERFDEPEQIVKYLSNTAEVYKALFKTLSNDYKELYDKWEELEFKDFERR